VFVANRRFPDGPNPWWDEALVNPHLELQDHIRMIHPELAANLPGSDDLTFYWPLTGVRQAPSIGSGTP
jgi:hypothetical protein